MNKVKKGVISCLLMGLLLCQLPAAEPEGDRLKDLAEPLGLFIGFSAPTNFYSMSDTIVYQEVAASEFNIVTPENAMKLDAICPTQNNYNFGPSDRLVQFARAHGMQVHGHTLIWYSAQPNWLVNIHSRDQLLSAMNNVIDVILGHFAGQILLWDVVNEAFNENGSYRSNFWLNVIGEDYIDHAFQYCRQADPAVKLIYNDYNIAEINQKSDGVYNMIESMIFRGIPIDGIGFQMHITDAGIDYQNFADNMARFAALGLEIYITEMDVRIPIIYTESDLNNQAEIYRQVIERCVDQPACKAIQFWGIPDKYSWITSVFPESGFPLLFDDDYNAKPAYYAVQQALACAGSVSTPVPRKLGDVNGDDTINIIDALLTAQFYVGLNPDGFIASRADVNCDGNIDILDALLIARHFVGLIDSFSYEH
ncbi:MAG: endo-1,4-beta-xylanase [Spirochaetales bacterium]|nr:endo-1,4-beta-xylanase [Spirochaetales bacterium]